MTIADNFYAEVRKRTRYMLHCPHCGGRVLARAVFREDRRGVVFLGHCGGCDAAIKKAPDETPAEGA